MPNAQTEIQIATSGPGQSDITTAVRRAVRWSHVDAGTCHIFAHALDVRLRLGGPQLDSEEARDPTRVALAPQTDSSSLCLPVKNSKLALGEWAALLLIEHQAGTHQRRLTITLSGARDFD